MSDVLVIPPRNKRDARRRVIAARSETARRNATRRALGERPEPLDLRDDHALLADMYGPTPAPTPSDPRPAPVRLPVTHLNYPGNIALDPDSKVGPGTLGEYLYPVAASYDPEADRTRVGFSYIAPVSA